MSRTAVNVHATSVNTTNISRQDLVDWVNDTLGFTYQKVENFCTGNFGTTNLPRMAALLKLIHVVFAYTLSPGAAYCQFMDMLFGPGTIPMKKVKFDAKMDYAFIENFKLLQNSFKKVKCDKMIPVERLVKGRFQDNFEFGQWFRKVRLLCRPLSSFIVLCLGLRFVVAWRVRCYDCHHQSLLHVLFSLGIVLVF
jgi:RP/EB family microtubule-associated protein